MKKAILRPAPPVDDVRIDDATLRGFAGYYMKRAWNVEQAGLAETLKPFDLRMITFSALVLIVDNPGLRQSQLANALDIERPNLVVILDELERRELITRDKVPADRRAYALNPTLTGRRLYNKAVAVVTTQEQMMFSALDADERRMLIRLLSKIENRKTGECA